MEKKKKILVMGLPGSGKSYLADKLASKINAVWLNADRVREEANDWDFTPEGR
jgi:adenylylsulfate kinase